MILKLKGNTGNRQIPGKRREPGKAAAELRLIRQQLDEAYAGFNRTSDPELLEACIYEINALLARHDHALKNVKTAMYTEGR